MSAIFTSILSNELDSAKRRFDAQCGQIGAEHAAKGTFHSGARLIAIEKAAVTAIDEFVERLVSSLTKFEPDHSPIDLNDFDEAKSAISSLSAYCTNQYLELQRPGRSATKLPMRPAAMAEAVERAKLALDAHKSVLKSKKSFWKWAWGDVRRRIFSGILVLAGAFAAEIVRRILSGTGPPAG